MSRSYGPMYLGQAGSVLSDGSGCAHRRSHSAALPNYPDGIQGVAAEFRVREDISEAGSNLWFVE